MLSGTVDIALTNEDRDRLVQLLNRLDRPGMEGLAWLLGEGVSHFTTDHGVWQHLAATKRTDDDPAARELQTREAQAHLVLMRVRATEMEARMETLRATVADLSPQYQKLTRRLFALQRERRELTAAPDLTPVAPAPDSGGSWRARVWNWLVGRRG